MEPEERALEGLRGQVEILIDRWGVPHIYAQNDHDLFFAQGFNAARDRLFQLDLWRRRGLGLLSEAFGASFVEQDRAARLFLYRGEMEREWAAYGPFAEESVGSFVDGVNSYIAWASEEPGRLPPEFELHGYEPSRWEAADVPRIRSHGLYYNVEQEVARATMMRDHGWVAEQLRQVREPSDPLTLPDGLDLDVFAKDVLRVYRLGRAPASVAPPVDGETSGSNNWVISGDRTVTGRPILANDPHRTVTLPSLRYIAHLSAPGIDVIGGGEPALPGISIGHNGQVAFGLTIWPADQEDLYVYPLSESGDAYRYGSEWEKITRYSETILDDSGAEHSVELCFTRHGPVIFEDAERGVALALRAAWLEPGAAPYLSSLGYLRAEDAEQFSSALERWATPPVNQVFADTSGRIGWKNAGLLPRRSGWDGGLPVPGDGRHEWDGFLDASELPGVVDPDAGWFATANQMNLPEGYPNRERTITYDWYPSSRYERIAAVLGAGVSHEVADSLALQNDSVNVIALEVRDLLAALPTAHIRESELFESLRTWNGVESVDSVTATVFQIWMRRHLRPLLLEHAMSDAFARAEDASGVAPGSSAAAAIHALRKEEAFSPDLRSEVKVLRALAQGSDAAVVTLAAMVDQSLVSAAAEIELLLGADRTAWRWGDLHHAEFIHPFLQSDKVPEAWRRLGPSPKHGSGDTVGMAAYDEKFAMTLGSTFRIVVDVGNWDASVAMNAPGQSGDPASPHYADLFQPWLDADAFPLCYSRDEVEKHTESRIILRPKRVTKTTELGGSAAEPVGNMAEERDA